MIAGVFETHITVMHLHAEELAGFAAEHGLKYVDIELDRGVNRRQPMVTLRGAGTLEQHQAVVEGWCVRMRAARVQPIRVKIEAAPWSTGVPETDGDATAEPDDRYFEHHVKLRLQSADLAGLLPVTELAERHGARLSRNARRRSAVDEERFVNQRCHGVGRAEATGRLDRLVADLQGAAYEVVAVEQEYVVHDSDVDLDRGWLTARTPEQEYHEKERERRNSYPLDRSVPYPATFQPLKRDRGVEQRIAFDPALKHHANAVTPGRPVFADAAAGQRWKNAQRSAMSHLLTVIAGTRWVDHLVLRGSATMATWVGTAARQPGDLDFVVTPPSMTSTSVAARALPDEIAAALVARPGAGLRPDRMTQSEIWTYERADGRRLVIPFTGRGIPDGTVQVDIVFGEHLPIPPKPITVLGVPAPMMAATAELSLAWKLLWLATDMYPQGKDLYDAVLLAEYTSVDLALVRELLRPDWGPGEEFTAETVLEWQDVDWPNFADEYPGVNGTVQHWLNLLAIALDRSWTSAG